MNFDKSACWYNAVCKNKDCSASCIRYLEMQALMNQSNIPKNRQIPQKLTVADEDYEAFARLAHIKANMLEFVEQGKNLYIFSQGTGNGKTSWAIKLMLKYFDSVWAGNGFRCRGMFIHVPTFLLQLKDFKTVNEELERIKSEMLNVDLIIFDDIASVEVSNYDMSQLLTYIDQRLLNQKSNIFTTNLDFDTLEKVVGQRLASRIYNTSEVVEFVGGDNR